MARREDIEAKAEALLLPLIEENKFELVDVEYVKEGGSYYLRIYIDKPGGITVNDCELISRAADSMLDDADFIQDSYIFEVSSPGLGRPLKKEKDYVRSKGKDIEIHLFKAVEDQKVWEGALTDWDKETVTITVEEKQVSFEKSNIALIRLAFDF